MKKLILILAVFVFGCNTPNTDDNLYDNRPLVIESPNHYEPEIIVSYDDLLDITNTEIGSGDYTLVNTRRGYFGKNGDTIQ